MPGSPSSPYIRLPKQWNNYVRSAVLHAISLAQFALTSARGQIQCRDRARDRRFAKIERLRQEIHLLKEELRLKDARMHRVPGRRRPYYHPVERLSILELRAARAWSLDQTAERMLVTSNTLSSWMGRLDEEDDDALLQTPEPVNKFPDFVAYLVRKNVVARLYLVDGIKRRSATSSDKEDSHRFRVDFNWKF